MLAYKILHESQFCFRMGVSTSMALLNLIENIITILDDKKCTAGVSIDLKKAFDTIDHNILLIKFNSYGIRGVISDWIHSYLSNHKQSVYFNGTKSDLLNITYRFPQ